MLKEIPLFDKMQECSVCGLVFLSGDICPGCGSNVHSEITSDDSVELEKDTQIPGMKEFLETSVGVIPESESNDEYEQIPSSTLPFGMGGDSVSMKSTLPFGVGSHSLFFKSKEVEVSPDDELSEGSRETSIELITNQVEESDDIHDSPPVELDIPENNLLDRALTKREEFQIESIFNEEIQNEDSENEVIIPDFDEENLTSEIQVDLDNLVDYNSTDSVFNPIQMEAAAEPELHPIKALAVEGLSDPELLSAVNEGFSAMSSENWELASYKFNKVARTGKGGAAALNNYGLALLQKAIEVFETGDGIEKALVDSQFEAAIFALRQAAQIEGQRSEILYNLAIALHRTAFYDKSMIVFDTLLQRDGPSPHVLNAKAVLLESKGDFEGAKKLLYQAINDSPSDEIIKSNLSRLVPM